MKIKYYERIKNQSKLEDIRQLLILCDKDFVPPLSARDSTSQGNFEAGDNNEDGPNRYYEDIRIQPAFVAEEGGHIIGFMSIKKDHVCAEIPRDLSPNIYITTIIVHPDHRKKGITNSFYQELFLKFKNRDIYTRTWSTNHSHIRILSSLKFYEHARKKDDRGSGIDTIYYHRESASPGKWQIIRQYHLTGNLVFLLLLAVFSVIFVLTWAFTEQGMMHELSIAFATSLIASALCLVSDTMLKYRESQNDEYITNLKGFGIENLQFRKDQILESMIPKCKHEIWISGYRLIMTGKQTFRDALCAACKKNPELTVHVLVVPPWSETFHLVYGTEDVTDNYINIFRDLCKCVEDYNTKLEIRCTDKPIFNDTYKIDDRFITSPYLHCVDEDNNGKIAAKDFFSLDINDPNKKLYELIRDDYIAMWDESKAKLSTSEFMKKFEEDNRHDLNCEERNKLLEACFEKR